MSAVQLADDGTDGLADLAGLLGSGGLAGADSPQGLVGDDHVTHLVGGHAGQSALDLVSDQLHGHAQLTLLQALAHTDDGEQAGVDGGVDLLVDGEVGLVIILAALGVADDDVLGAGLLDHLSGDLTGVSAVILIVAGLSADGDVAVLEQADGGLDVGGGHTQHHVAPLAAGHDGLELLSKSLGLGQGVVHLPVAGDDSLTVTTIHVLFLPFLYTGAVGDDIEPDCPPPWHTGRGGGVRNNQTMLSRCGLDTRPGRFRCDSGHKQPGPARLGLNPSLRSKLPCVSILRAS